MGQERLTPARAGLTAPQESQLPDKLRVDEALELYASSYRAQADWRRLLDVLGLAGGGFGLTAMRQRLHGLAGTLEIESEPGAGTAVCASVPVLPAGAGSD